MNAGPRRRIVVGIDGSDSLNDPVVTAALEHATLSHAELRFVHALTVSLPDVDAPPDVRRRAIADRSSRIRATTAELRQRLAAHLAERRPQPPVVCYDVRYGDPATLLLMAAQEADLIVLGTHDPRRTDRRSPFLLGSVSQDVALHARCPILLVPAACASL